MADKEQSLIVLDSWEGGYSNNSKDPGGETYCGIARRMWPNWAGWAVIDRIKNERLAIIPISNRGIKHNEYFSELNDQVSGFYTDNFWNKQSFAQLDNQDICDKIFQHYVNMGDRAIKFIQSDIQDFGESIVIDGKMGPRTVSIANRLGAQALLTDYITHITSYYEELITEHPQLEYARHEWMLRAKTIGKRPS